MQFPEQGKFVYVILTLKKIPQMMNLMLSVSRISLSTLSFCLIIDDQTEKWPHQGRCDEEDTPSLRVIPLFLVVIDLNHNNSKEQIERACGAIIMALIHLHINVHFSSEQ
ncbi:hypothetical protein F2Q69_00002142 [Brassica cretica]|uniref:Uncharacterized protein n=1 Tax=Brassica cretica TaxID=69181 RepID=A0A8S9PEP4_BRACR|nr:hypothetical protein F2Q69_00002142 [Brassica cretica]